MRSPVLAIVAISVVLTGCAFTPRQKCEAPYRADLRNVTEEIGRTKMALARGFVLVPARDDFGLHHCLLPNGFVRLCSADEGEPMYDKRPINEAAEQAKLAVLESEAMRLEAGISACRAEYPE